MTASVSFEISEYLPIAFNYDGFKFNFVSDEFEAAINVIII